MAKMQVNLIADRVLECALSHEPGSRVVGNVMACELAALAMQFISSCPQCGAEPWVNIDCAVCRVCSVLYEDTSTPPTTSEEE